MPLEGNPDVLLTIKVVIASVRSSVRKVEEDLPTTTPRAAITSFPKITESNIAPEPVLLEVPKFVSLNSFNTYLFVPFILR